MKFFCLLLFLPGLLGYKFFQNRIPNGRSVPHPCKVNYVWEGVGHMNKDGGGMRNPFGEDFDRNGQKWDECLCRTDSDGDGRTNGEELGDPDCVWQPGDEPAITELSKITHPGICDPYDAPECIPFNNWEFCEQEDFKCDAINEKDVESFTIRFPPTPVPAKETTYMCMVVDIPTDGDWHVIASEPVIDNANVMHHVVVSLCTEEAVNELEGKFDQPAECGTMPSSCSGGLFGWTVGVNGECVNDVAGYRIGNTTGYTKAIMEFHWNNPEEVDGYIDGSGMKYYYTPHLRANDISTVMTGTFTLEIPPQQLYHEQVGVCDEKCSNFLMNDTTRYILNAFPHMHYLGQGFVIEHWRGDMRLDDLINIESYSYDNPKFYHFDPPRELQSGDRIVTRCFFNSMNRQDWTFLGEGTQEEMCYGFLSTYPGDFFACIGNEERSYCSHPDEELEWMYLDRVCDYEGYMVSSFEDDYVKLAGSCDESGRECFSMCKKSIEEVMTEACYNEGQDIWLRMYLATEDWGRTFLQMLNSCSGYEPQFEKDDSVGGHGGDLCLPTDRPTAAATKTRVPVLLMMLAVAVFMAVVV